MAISSSVSRQSAAKPGAMTSISPSCDHYGARLPLTFGPLVVTAEKIEKALCAHSPQQVAQE
jgi:hypothetical protein